MFALYYEQDNGRLTWIASCHDVRSARNLAQVYSSGSEWAVTCIYNGGNGTTRRCCTYKKGYPAIEYTIEEIADRSPDGKPFRSRFDA
jgi:hypothetical protein